MAQQILHIRFRFDHSPADYEALCMQVSGEFTRVPGLRWKIWTTESGRGSGVYLFEDEATLQAYLAGPIVEQVKSGAFGLFDVEIWHQAVQEAPTSVTRGPVRSAAAA